MSIHRQWMSAALAGSIACTAPFASAREPSRAAAGVDAGVAAVAVDSVDVEQVASLGAGVALNFTVFGTTGALVDLRIDGARRRAELRESEPGVYEGSYVIDAQDAIRPDSRVIATLQRRGSIAYSALDEPLLLAKGTVPWDLAAASPGPGSAAPAAVPATAPAAVAEPTAMPIPITMRPSRPVRPVPTAPYAGAASQGETCSDCAVVESVRAVEAAPRGGAIGTIGGAIAGAILGKELGAAHTRRVLTVLGAIAGALTGREIEREATRSTHYDVDLRLADGSLLKRRYEQQPPFVAGATIRLSVPTGRGAPVPAPF